MKEPPPGLPHLPEDDPQNTLPDASRRRILAARVDSDIIRDKAIAELHTRYRSEPESGITFEEYCGIGDAAIKLYTAKMDAARKVLFVMRDEFRRYGQLSLRQI